MGRFNPDLKERLLDPAEARLFIDDPYTWSPTPKPPHIFISIDHVISLDTSKISDGDAVLAAQIILRDVFAPTVLRKRNQEMYENPDVKEH